MVYFCGKKLANNQASKQALGALTTAAGCGCGELGLRICCSEMR